jgi:hypothetical protein
MHIYHTYSRRTRRKINLGGGEDDMGSDVYYTYAEGVEALEGVVTMIRDYDSFSTAVR